MHIIAQAIRVYKCQNGNDGFDKNAKGGHFCAAHITLSNIEEVIRYVHVSLHNLTLCLPFWSHISDPCTCKAKVKFGEG